MSTTEGVWMFLAYVASFGVVSGVLCALGIRRIIYGVGIILALVCLAGVIGAAIPDAWVPR